MAKKKIKNYVEAVDEINQIIEEIENDELDVDNLSIKIKRASELFDFCKNKLHKTEEEVEKIMEVIE